MRYREYESSRRLSPWVDGFWIFDGEYAAAETETIVADGFPELIIHFGRPYTEFDGEGQLCEQPAAIVSGQLTRPLLLQAEGRVGVMAIRFSPAGLTRFASLPMRLLTDARIPADDIFPDIEQLVDQVRQAQDDRHKVAACERYLWRHLRDTDAHPAVNRALDVIHRTRGNLSATDLARTVSTGLRSLELAFQQHVGISPKQFCRVIRFHSAYELLTGEQSQSAALTAAETGFFDQSHLIRDFQQFAGDSPASFLSEISPLNQALHSEDG